MILDLHHRHSAEGSTEVQGNAPLLSVTRGEKGTPESSYPLSHIRQDERAGRDSQEAFAQRASEKGKGSGRCPATTTAALLDGALPPIREDQIPSPTPRARHQDAGWRIHRQAERSLTATTAKLLKQVPSNRTHGEPALFGIQVPSFPSRHQPRRINPPRTERPNPPREDQGPSPPAGPHAFTCSRPGVTFPSPPCNRNST